MRIPLLLLSVSMPAALWVACTESEDPWGSERRSQEFSHSITTLWDDLLREPDKIKTILGFRFESIRLPGNQARETDELGVERKVFAGSGATLTFGEWEKLLRGLSAEGYRLESAEWHHASFRDGADDSPPESKYEVEIYGSNPRSGSKVMARAELRIAWNTVSSLDGSHAARSVEVDKLEITELVSSRAAFSETVVGGGKGGARGSADLAGLIASDLTGDGAPDIVLPAANELLVNDGRGRFKARPLLPDRVGGVVGALLADLDQDGRADLFLTRQRAEPLIYLGKEGGEFRRDPAKVSVPGAVWPNPQLVTAGDIDGDGDLDLWIAQYKSTYDGGIPPDPYYDANDGYPSYLLLNLGSGGLFSDATEAAGLGSKRKRRTYSASFFDADADGDSDLLVVSDFAGVDLHLNDGSGRFKDATDWAFEETHLFGMSHAFGDFNADGLLDVFVTGMNSYTAMRLEGMGLGPGEFSRHQEMRPRMSFGNRLYLGVKGGRFRETEFAGDVARTGWSWGSTALDVENDGDDDIFVANGHITGASAKDYCSDFWRYDIYPRKAALHRKRPEGSIRNIALVARREISWDGFQHDRLLANRGGAGFLEVGHVSGAGSELDSRSAIAEDFDLDGRADILFTEERGPKGSLRMLRNSADRGNNWIGVRLREAPGANPMNARILVRYAGGSKTSEIVSGDSFRCQRGPIRLFGLGKTGHVDSVEVRWHDGRVRTLTGPAINRYHDVVPGDEKR